MNLAFLLTTQFTVIPNKSNTLGVNGNEVHFSFFTLAPLLTAHAFSGLLREAEPNRHLINYEWVHLRLITIITNMFRAFIHKPK